jgi:hypothetical protein
LRYNENSYLKRISRKKRGTVKLHTRTSEPETFDAEITTDHPSDIAGPIALKCKDTGTFIAFLDVFMGPARKYDIIDATDDERSRLEAGGIMLL